MVVQGIDALRVEHGRLFVAVGVFDGLHLGHLYLLRHLQAAALSRGARSAVITFDHHPDEILLGAAPPLLCDPDERLELLATAGVDVTIVQTFDAALRMTSFEDFVRRIAERVDLAGFLMTPDAAFGHERRGTVAAVTELGRTLGYEVVVVPPMQIAGHAVRSASIRASIAKGDLAAASAMLGRDYAVIGMIDSAVRADRADLAASENVLVRFSMPVALPPAGDYRVAIGTTTGGATVLRDIAAIVGPDNTLELPDLRIVAGLDRIRVTFDARRDKPLTVPRSPG